MEEEKKEEIEQNNLNNEETETPNEENKPLEENKPKEEKAEEKKEEKNQKLKIIIMILIIIIIILLLLRFCGRGNYKIKLHYGNEVIEVDENFNLDDLEVEGGKASFLVDSDGHIVTPGSKLDHSKEYSTHLIPDGKEKVKVTYKWDDKSLVVEYQKGAGLLFPEDPVKKGYVFIAWKFEDKDEYPVFMMPVDHDMVIVAVFDKSKEEGGKCTLNCDTNSDSKCDLNCDKNGDGKPNSNVDTDGDGKPDTNIDKNHDNVCDLNCDTNGDGKPNTNVDTDGDGSPDMNVDTNGDGTPDTNVDTNGDGICDSECVEGNFITKDYETSYHVTCNLLNPYWEYNPKNTEFVYLEFDGKVIKEDEFKTMGNGLKYWSFGDYKGSSKKIKSIFKIVYTDPTGQKIYYVYNYEFTFEANCLMELTCEDYDNGFYYISPVKKEDILYAYIGNGKAEPDKYLEKDGESYPMYNITSLYGSHTYITTQIHFKYKDKDGNTLKHTDIKLPKDCDLGDIGVSEYTMTFDANGGTVSKNSMSFIQGQLVSDLPTPVRDGYQFVGWYTEANGGTLINNDYQMPENNITAYAHWESNGTGQDPTPTPQPEPTPTPQPEVDNGTISLSTSNKCIINGQGTSVTANVNNAKNPNVDWLADSCLAVSSSGNTASVSGRGCSVHPTITGRLSNGASDTLTFDFEENLIVTVTDDGTGSPNANGKYYGVRSITTNIPAVISSPNGSILSGESSSLRTSVNTYAGKEGNVTITTPCGQTQTILWTAEIN